MKTKYVTPKHVKRKSETGKTLPPGITYSPKKGAYIVKTTLSDGTRPERHFKTADEALVYYHSVKALRNDPAAASNMTVDDFVEKWLLACEFRDSTKSSYMRRCNKNIRPVIGRKRMSEVTPSDCQNILTQMAESKRKTGSIKLTRKILVSMFQYAIDDGILVKSPVNKRVRVPDGSLDCKPPAYLSKKDLGSFLEEARKCDHFFQFALMLMTGIRVSELTGLRWQNVDFENKNLNIDRILYRFDRTLEQSNRILHQSGRTLHQSESSHNWKWGPPKTGTSTRTIPLTEQAIEILKCQRAKRDRIKGPEEFRDLVFCSRNGYPLDICAYNKSLKRVCDKIGIDPISTHKLRHFFASNIYESVARDKAAADLLGMPVPSAPASEECKIVSGILGHSSTVITQGVYVHAEEEAKREAMEQSFMNQAISEYLSPKLSQAQNENS